MPDAGTPRTTAVRIVQLGTEHEAVDLREADSWYVVLTPSGEPVLRIETPSPGDTADGGLVELLLSRRADPVVWRRRLTAELCDAYGGAPPEHSMRPTVSVLVCTHRRPGHLPFLLDALRRLDPAPDEIIIVDNDPGEEDCRELVERSGARYVREDRRGQDNARNAGLGVACGDVIAFTDDDCVPSPGWLANVPENFADPLVAVSTGPGFPWALDTPAQEHIEREGGFMRGLERRLLDWRVLPPIHAGAAGAGANMMVRRSAFGSVTAPWPPELGPGTPTESGDDTYVLSRFLAAGYRIVYDPRQWFQHQHRADWPALRQAVRGYGTGSMCMLLKSLTEDGETEAPRGLSWIARRYVRSRWGLWVGHTGAVEMRSAADYVRGAAAGPARLRASRRAYAQSGGRAVGLNVAAPGDAVAFAPPGAARAARSLTDLSVVVALEDGVDPTSCLRCLGAGTARPAETITVGPGTSRPTGADRHVPCEPNDGVGTRWSVGAAAATGRAVLLLRASMTPAGALVASHARQHARGADVVVGGRHVLPADASLASSWTALASRTPSGGPCRPDHPWSATWAGNVSVSRAATATATIHGDRPIDVDELVRDVAARGGRVVHDGSAAVTVTVGASLEDLVGGSRLTIPLLGVLERLNQRRLWSRIVRRQVARGRHRVPSVSRIAQLDLAGPDLPGRYVEPSDRLDVALDGRRLGTVLLVDRPEPETLAARVAELLDREPHAWEELAVARGWTRARPQPTLRGRLSVLATEADTSVGERDVELAGLCPHAVLAQVREVARSRASPTDWIAVVAPGLRAHPDVIDDLAPVLCASRIGCLYGSRSLSPLQPPLTLSCDLTPQGLGQAPVDYVVVRAWIAAELSDAEVRRSGVEPRAALMWLLERSVRTGALLGRLDARGLSPRDDGALRAREVAHRSARGWWLGARARSAPPGAPRRTAARAAAVELLLARRRGTARGVLPTVLAGLRFVGPVLAQSEAAGSPSTGAPGRHRPSTAPVA